MALNLFEKVQDQNPIIDSRYITVRPSNPLEGDNPIVFQIPGNPITFIDLGSTWLYIKARVKHRDGTILAEDEHVAPVNGLFYALFDAAAFEIEGHPIVPNGSNYGYALKAVVNHMLTYQGGVGNTYFASTVGWRKDQGPDPSSANRRQNFGAAVRAATIEKSREFELMGHLPVAMFNQNKLLLNRTNSVLRLKRNTADFCLLSPDAEASKYVIELMECNLHVRYCSLDPAATRSIEASLKRAPAVYPHTSSFCVSTSLIAHQSSCMIGSIWCGAIPRRMVMVMQSSQAADGVIGKNPFCFPNFDVSRIEMKLNGELLAGEAVTGDFDKAQYMQIYANTIQNHAKTMNVDIDYKDFANCMIVGFDLNDKIREGDLSAAVSFRRPLTEPIYIILIGEFLHVVSIDQNRSVRVEVMP